MFNILYPVILALSTATIKRMVWGSVLLCFKFSLSIGCRYLDIQLILYLDPAVSPLLSSLLHEPQDCPQEQARAHGFWQFRFLLCSLYSLPSGFQADEALPTVRRMHTSVCTCEGMPRAWNM